MTKSIQDFIDDWESESKNTFSILDTLTDASLSQIVYSDGRTIAEIAWHIVITVGEMTSATGLNIIAPEQDSSPPKVATDIASSYQIAANSLSEELKSKWNDAMLLEEIDMYGEKWKRGFLLDVLVKHEIHHRAQLTVLMRQAGLKVPGIYGPSKEEWEAMGMPAQK
jgi:uncharacterized damage-inducible protein DinB